MVKTKINKSTLSRLFDYAKPYFWWFVLAFLCIVVIVFIDLYQPILIGNAADAVVDGLSSDKEATKLIVLQKGLIYVAMVVVALILTYIEALILTYVGQKVIYSIRMDVFSHIQSLSMNYFNHNPIGRLVTRVTNDIETLNEMYTSVIVNVLQSIFTLFGIIFMMISYNVKLALIVFTVIPLIAIFTAIYQKYSRQNYRFIRKKVSELNAFISEHITGMRLVQIFNVEDSTLAAFKKRTESLKKYNLRQITIFSIYRPSNYLLKIVALILVLYFGSQAYFAGLITIGTIVIFQRYITKFFEPIQTIAEQLDIVQSASASAERIFALMDEKPEITDKKDAIELKQVVGKIEFKHVWFSYIENEWILKDVSFTINPGENVAFVGETGAGKTTIQNLITRYYDIQKGEILIDGINIKDIKISSLRSCVGQMLQDVFLFTGDIKSNISLNDPSIDDETILKASKYVNADKFISELEHQYQEEVIERGSSLSAGQRQLLSFARTLAFKPEILILDEATSNIDTETEVLIQDALEKLMKNRTTLIVAHRLSTIQNADMIIVMHKGRIIEKGNHQELLQNEGMYYKLYQLQLN